MQIREVCPTRKAKNVQAHASLSKDLTGSLLDGNASESEARLRIQPLLSVRQIAAILGVCAATVYRMCEQRKLPHFRVRNAIRVPLEAVTAYLARARR